MSNFVNRRFYLLIFILILGVLLSSMLGFAVLANEGETLSINSRSIKDSDGDGVFEISTRDELIAFCELVNSGISDIDARLVADIYFNGEEKVLDGTSRVADTSRLARWTPIGSAGEEYCGTFDGAGYTVNGLYCDLIGEQGKYAGFFGVISEGGVVKNVCVENSYFGARQYVGGIAASSEGDIANCMVSAALEASSDGACYAGGIVGVARGNATIKNCLNVIKVSGKGKRIGGIAGFAEEYVNIINSHNVAEVRGVLEVGGVLGYSDAVPKECFYLEGCAISNVGTPEQKAQNGVGNQDSDTEGATAKISEKDIKNGKLAYLLQNTQKIDKNGEAYQLWGQDLTGNEKSPCFSDKRVYRIGNCGVESFSNTEGELLHLSLVNGFCSYCGEYEAAVAVIAENCDSLGLDEEHIGSYAIANAGQLYWFAQMLEYQADADLSAVMTDDVTVNDNLFEELEGGSLKSWLPMAQGMEYTGVFDGNVHSISGLYYDTEGVSVGFFERIGALGVVKNLGISDSFYFVGQNSNLGAIAGENHGEVINCYSVASLYGDETYSHIRGIGGIVGINYGKISRCYNNGKVYVLGGKGDHAGGVVGINAEGSCVENCYNLGEIYLDSSLAYVGGIAGSSYGSVRKCFNQGEVALEAEGSNVATSSCVGGVVGILYEDGEIFGCWNEATVSAASGRAGGIVGELDNGRIGHCYNVGKILGGGWSAGIAAYASQSSEISDCYNIGEISCDEIAGSKNTISNPESYGKITNCYCVDSDIPNGRAIEISAEKLKNGELCVLLGGTGIWRQGEEYPEIICDDIPPAILFLNITEAFINKGEGIELSVRIAPEIALNKDVVWSSDNEDVLIVDKNGRVTALDGGVANVTVRSVDGNKKAVCRITVHKHVYRYEAVGNVLIATCEGEVGVCDEKSKTESLDADMELVYDPEKKKAYLFGTLDEVSDSQITYSLIGGQVLDAPPTDVGSYIATFNFGGSAIIQIEFSIGKREEKDLNALNTIDPPVACGLPQGAVNGKNWRGTVVWNCETERFDWNTIYTATVTLIADENYKFAKELSCDGWEIISRGDTIVVATKSFERTAKRKIETLLSAPEDTALTEHMADANALSALLPSSVKVQLESNGEADIDIVWSCETYNTAPNATNIFVWTADEGSLSQYDVNGTLLSGSISVTNPQALPVYHTPYDKNVSFNVGVFDVSQLFLPDVNAGKASYSIADGGSGSGELNGTMLTIKSSGTIKIKLTTKENGIYAAGESLAFITVVKGLPEYTSPGVLNAYYGQTLGEIGFPEDEKGTWRWDESSSTPVGAVGTRTHKAIFSPYDTKNFERLEVTVTIYVAKKVIPYPTIASKAYNSRRQTADVSDTEYYRVEKNLGGIAVGAYDVVFTLKDPDNCKWPDSDKASVTLKFNITKATNSWLTSPSIEDWSYGSAAKTPVASAKFGEVSVKYRLYGTEDEYVSSLPTNAGIYEAYFYVEASDDYGSLSRSVRFVVSRRMLTVSADAASKRYGEKDPVLTWRITGGSLVGEDVLDVLISRKSGESAGEYAISVCHGELGNPNYNITFVGATFTVVRDDAYIVIPTGLRATYGDTLANISLPDGFVWQLPLTTSVGNAGSNVFMVSYIPYDTENYNVITDIEVTVEVAKASQTISTELSDRYSSCRGTLDARYANAIGKISFESSDSEIASVNAENGRITVYKAGEVIITISAEGTDNYLPASVSYKLIIAHGYGSEWVYDANEHWKECECGEKGFVASHTASSSADCGADVVCTVCERILVVGEEHSYSSEWKSGTLGHWKECVCGETTATEAHDYCETVCETAKKIDADCTNPAVYFKSCSVCGYIGNETFSDVEPLGHGFINYISDNNATCTADGTKTAKCARCDVSDIKTDEGSRLGHTFGEYVSNNNATCTADGTKTAKCTRCDVTDTKTDEGSRLGHTFGEYVSNNNATCTADGTKTAKCVRCEERNTLVDENSTLGHSFISYVSDNNATCTADGTKTAKCTRCDVTDTKTDEGSRLGHTFGEYVSNNNATCTADGTKTAKCIRCEERNTLVDENSTLGHSFVNYISDENATCTSDGTKTAKCVRCAVTDTLADVGSMTEHEYSGGECIFCGKEDESWSEDTTTEDTTEATIESTTESTTTPVTEAPEDSETVGTSEQITTETTESQSGATETLESTRADVSEEKGLSSDGESETADKTEEKDTSSSVLTVALAVVLGLGACACAWVIKKRV